MLSDNDVHPVLHEVLCGVGQGGQIALRESHPDDEVLVLTVA
jgi:hypothetical protein